MHSPIKELYLTQREVVGLPYYAPFKFASRQCGKNGIILLNGGHCHDDL